MKNKNVVYFMSNILLSIKFNGLKLLNKILNKILNNILNNILKKKEKKLEDISEILKELYIINEKLNVICIEIELLKEKN
jgi:hypothetical protein